MQEEALQGYRLSPQQRHLWALLGQGRDGSYQAKCAVTIKGNLEPSLFKKAILDVIARHEILRTTFHCLPEMTIPMQVINETVGLSWREDDLSGMAEQASSIEGFFHEASQPFDFEKGPLLYLHLIRKVENDYVMIVRLPAICADATSLRNLVGEFCCSYQAAVSGEELDCEAPQYADLAEWQNELVEAEETRKGGEYWRNRHLLHSPKLQLVFEKVPAREAAFAPRFDQLEIAPSLTTRIESFARSAETSLEQVLLGCWSLLLWRHTGQPEIEVGTAFDGRRSADVEGALGLFAKYLPVTCHLEDGLPFSRLIAQIDRSFLSVREWQEFFSWEQIVESPASASEPFFHFCFEPETVPATFSAGAISGTIFKQYACIDRFKMKLSYARRSDWLVAEFHYDSELFRAVDIRSLMGHFQALLENAIAHPDVQVGALEMITDAERRQLLFEYNLTRIEWPRDKFIHELFLEQVERAPDAIAAIYEEQQLTYRDMDERATKLAHYLRGLGVGPEVLVGLCMERSLDLFVSLLAVLKAGGAYLPLDPSYPQARLSFMLEDAATTVVLTQNHLRSLMAQMKQARVVYVDAQWEMISQIQLHGCKTMLLPGNLAYVIYTSGSTGRPKGVMVRHRSLVNYTRDICRRLGVGEGGAGDGLKFATVSTITADLGNTCIYPSLASGGCLHILSYDVVTDSLRFNRYLRQNPIDVLKITPSHLESLLGSQSEEMTMLPQQYLILGGATLSREMVERIWERGEGCEVINHYGPTETTIGSLTARAKETEETWGRAATAPIGRPIANTEAYVLDRKLKPAPLGVRGELYIAGEGVARGYWGRPELTAERFVPNPFCLGCGDRLYRTGDVVRHLPDGQIEFFGRVDNQVKIRGYRVELGEIEAVLDEHESVRQSIVVASDNGKSDKSLVGYVVGPEGTAVAELKKYVRERLPEYMVPEVILVLAKMPLTANGKIDRGRLPSVKDADREPNQEDAGAQTPLEEMVAGIFEEVLKLDRVGRHDNFFEIGGHSLLATQVISRVRAAFGVEIGVRSIFRDGTIAGLARRIEEAIRAGEKTEAPPLVMTSREGQRGARLPLSFAQQRLWFLDQLAPNNPFYNIPGRARLGGRLDFDALQRVINEIVRRHEVLRTRFEVETGEPVQVIDQWEARRLEVTDLTGLLSDERDAEVGRIAREEAETGFDLSRGPLLRVRVLKLDEDEHLLLYTMHHIVSDGWSIEILSREVGALYRAYSAGEPSPLPELPIQYADFAVWQREWLQGEVLEHELRYWRKQLAGVEDLELPIDHPRPAVRSYRGARRHFAVDRELAGRLRELSRRVEVTLFMTLLAGFDLLLSRYSGQADVALGTDIANRNRKEIEGLIGFFVNQLVLRVEVSVGESFGQLLKNVRDVCLGAYAHQDVPFEKLVEDLQPERDLSRSPLFQAKLIWQTAPGQGLEPTGMMPINSDVQAHTARVDLTMAITDLGRDLVGAVTYSRDLFEDETIERLISHYTNVLKGIVEESERPIRDLNLLGESEREQIVSEWNQTVRPYPVGRRIHELFREQAVRTPDRRALICEGRQVSYRELDWRASQLASYLGGVGVGPEVVVGLCLERSVEMVVGLLGALKAGGAYLPLDPEAPLERLALMLEDAGVGVVLTQKKFEARLPAFWGQTILIDAEWERISGESESEPQNEAEAESLAYMIYTSGSTGRPKAVMVRHRSLVNYTHDICRQLGLAEGGSEGLQFATVSTITADLGNTCIYPSLLSGGCLHVLSYEVATDGARFEEYLKEEPIDVLKIVPSHLSALLGAQSQGARMLPERYLILGGEALSPELLERIRNRGEGCEVINHYGPTETTIGSLTSRVSEDRDERRRGGTSPIGRPIANTEVYVLNREFEPVPVGVRGELYIAGEGVARGYWGRPELTAERFVPNQLGGKGGGRLYRTGDVVRYLSDGKIEFIGRRDNQVKVRGYRIELGEIEAVLNEHRSVRQSVVVADENERGEKRLLGYVVGEEEAPPAELKRYVRERLPEYMVPEAILMLEEIPLTANGKVDRKILPSVKDAGRQPELGYEAGTPSAARTPIEEMVAGIFGEVLKFDRIGREDNFFEIGGHSLLAIQVISRVRNTFGVEIGVGIIFEAATVAGLASRIEEAIKAGETEKAPPLVKISREGRKSMRLPLSFAQQRLWFIDQLEPGNTIYNNPGAVRLGGRLDLGILERVINEVVRRHETLRTRFEVEAGEPVQVIDEWRPRSLEVVDLSIRSREEREEEVSRIMKEEARTGFDLSRGPMFRVKVLKLEEDEHVALYTMHHIMSDGWSKGILTAEINRLYEAYNRGIESPLPELPIQYGDFAVWQREWLQGAALERELSYWRKQLAGMEDLELPADHPRTAVRSYRGARRRFVVERELTERLRALGQREGVTLFMVFLAGFDLLMSRYSGQEDVALGTDIANRNRAEIEGLIGFFVNQLVLRVEVRAEESFSQLLKRVREMCLGAYAHQDAPFERLVEELQPERDLSRSPLFQAKLIWQNVQREVVELGDLKRVGGGGVDAEIMREAQIARFDLTVSLTDTGGELVGSVDYSRDLFEEETIERLASHYINVLRGIVCSMLPGESERPIRSMSLLSETEREQIVVEWNRTGRPYPQDRCVHELFTEQAERIPERIALIGEWQQVSYGELNRRANRLAAYLQGLGVGPEVVVGVCLERSVEMVVAIMGVLKTGGAYLPLDPAYPLERLSFVLEDARVGVVLTEWRVEARLPAFGGLTVLLDEEWRWTGEEGEGIEKHGPESRIVAENLAYVIYTSGSTGRPKGVMVAHQGVCNLVEAQKEAFRIGEWSRVLQFASISFDASVSEIFCTLTAGGSLHVYERENLMPGDDLLRVLREDQITAVTLPPTVLAALKEEELRHLRTVIAAGEACSAEIVERWGRGRRFLDAYGPTESTVCATIGECELGSRRKPAIGGPVANMRLYILDRELEPAPIRVRGELLIAGVGLARGYWGRPDLTAEKFIPDLFDGSGGRLYRTGDLGRYSPAGCIEFAGRIDHQIKIRGYRIEPAEIEGVLMQAPSIRECIVIAREDESSEKRLVAYLVVEEGFSGTTLELRQFLRQRLPAYLVPSSFVVLDSLPLSPNGKVDRNALPAPGEQDVEPGGVYVAPGTPIEQDVAGILREALGVKDVGIYDDFFALGGHSLLATRVINRVNSAFQVELPIRALFDTPTVSGIVAAIIESQVERSEDEVLSQMLAELETLSDDEVDAAFNNTAGFN